MCFGFYGLSGGIQITIWWTLLSIHVVIHMYTCENMIDLLRSKVNCIGCFVLLQLWSLRCWQKESFLVQSITEMALANEEKGLGHSKCDIMLLYILNEIGARFVKLKNYKYHYISAKQKIMWKIFSFFTCIKRISYFILKYTLYIIVSFKFML